MALYSSSVSSQRLLEIVNVLRYSVFMGPWSSTAVDAKPKGSQANSKVAVMALHLTPLLLCGTIGLYDTQVGGQFAKL